ncbi:MAG: hypothetical protein VZS44_11255 [Bacilli bacterium]|nr:hypothetical protein [Bacilli bacterium]
MKTKIKENDILCLRNGKQVVFGENVHRVILDKYYNDKLENIEDKNLDIISVKRPYYEDIFKTPQDIHNMDRMQLETELIERRLQVQNLIHEIQRKDEYIRIYSEGLNKIMEENSKKKTLKKGE